jgi:hypothetical protein
MMSFCMFGRLRSRGLVGGELCGETDEGKSKGKMRGSFAPLRMTTLNEGNCKFKGDCRHNAAVGVQ